MRTVDYDALSMHLDDAAEHGAISGWYTYSAKDGRGRRWVVKVDGAKYRDFSTREAEAFFEGVMLTLLATDSV